MLTGSTRELVKRLPKLTQTKTHKQPVRTLQKATETKEAINWPKEFMNLFGKDKEEIKPMLGLATLIFGVQMSKPYIAQSFNITLDAIRQHSSKFIPLSEKTQNILDCVKPRTNRDEWDKATLEDYTKYIFENFDNNFIEHFTEILYELSETATALKINRKNTADKRTAFSQISPYAPCSPWSAPWSLVVTAKFSEEDFSNSVTRLDYKKTANAYRNVIYTSSDKEIRHNALLERIDSVEQVIGVTDAAKYASRGLALFLLKLEYDAPKTGYKNEILKALSQRKLIPSLWNIPNVKRLMALNVLISIVGEAYTRKSSNLHERLDQFTKDNFRITAEELSHELRKKKNAPAKVNQNCKLAHIKTTDGQKSLSESTLSLGNSQTEEPPEAELD